MKLSYETIFNAVVELLTRTGVADDVARTVAESLVRANARGIHSHGVKYLKMITARINAGQMEIADNPAVVEVSRANALVDGKNGIGQVAAALAMQQSIESARAYGIAMTLVRNTNNIGFLSNYPMMAASEEMIGICACNAASSISLWGGMEPVLGSNPISLAFPTDGEYPLVMDLSVSNVARGKIREAERLGKPIPPTWAFGPDGNPTEDPAEALKGVLMPIGGPKGVALAIAVDILAGVLSGSKYSKAVKTFHKLTGATGVGAFFLAIDPSAFIDPTLLKQLLGKYIVEIKDIEKAQNVDELYLPGEIENAKEALSRAEGIDLDEGTVEMVDELLAEAGSDLRLG